MLLSQWLKTNKIQLQRWHIIVFDYIIYIFILYTYINCIYCQWPIWPRLSNGYRHNQALVTATSVTAIVSSRFTTQCHQFPGTKIVSWICASLDAVEHGQDTGLEAFRTVYIFQICWGTSYRILFYHILDLLSVQESSTNPGRFQQKNYNITTIWQLTMHDGQPHSSAQHDKIKLHKDSGKSWIASW